MMIKIYVLANFSVIHNCYNNNLVYFRVLKITLLVTVIFIVLPLNMLISDSGSALLGSIPIC